VLTMNSVKILHAVRSAITATAELLVIVIIRMRTIVPNFSLVGYEMTEPWAFVRNDVMAAMLIVESMTSYLKADFVDRNARNYRAKFRPGQIGNGGALGFLFPRNRRTR